MMDWEPRVGMRVVCINDQPRHWEEDGYIYPNKGHIYTIRQVVFDNLKTGLLLVEIHNPTLNGDGEAYFNCRNFRPLDERRLDIFRSILTKAPSEKEPA